VPTPLPSAEQVLLVPPDANETAWLGRGVVTAVAAPEGLTELQQLLVRALFVSMTGHEIDPTAVQAVGPAEFADGLARRNLEFRTRIVQIMLLCGLVLAPMPAVVAARLREFADELGVDDDIIAVAQAYADGALDLAGTDFARNGYLASVEPARLTTRAGPTSSCAGAGTRSRARNTTTPSRSATSWACGDSRSALAAAR